MKKSIFSIFFIIFLMTVVFVPSKVYASYPIDTELNCQGAILINLDTDVVIFEKNPDEKLEPASTTKIMVALLVLENISDIQNTLITVPDEAIDALLGTNSSLSGLKRGEILTAEQLLHCLMLPSGNDAAMVFASYLGNGDISNFIDMMNNKAKELGCENTNFANPHGLHDVEHYTTARDLAKIAQEAMKYDKFMEIVKKTRYTIPPTNKNEKSRILVTTNLMSDRINGGDYYYKYIQGIKTGSTVEAGYCFVSSAYNSKLNNKYLCVCLDAPMRDADGNKLKNGAFLDTKSLYESAFNNFSIQTVVEKNTPVKQINVEYAWDISEVVVGAKEDFVTMLPNGITSKSIVLVPNDDVATSLEAPIQKGQVVGTANIVYANVVLGTVELVTMQDIPESSLLRLLDNAKSILTSWWFIGGVVILVLLIVVYFVFSIRYSVKKKKMAVNKSKKSKRF